MLVLLDLGGQWTTAAPQAPHGFRIVYNTEINDCLQKKG